MWYIHTMQYYSAIKRNEILTYATIKGTLKTLSEISQSQKDKYCI